MASRFVSVAVVALAIGLGVFVLPALQRTATVWGFFKETKSTALAFEHVVLEDTKHCEDLHYYEPSNQLFTACEGANSPRYSWFPPLANFDDASLGSKSRGSFRVIDPDTMKVTALMLDGFDDPFVTHGIDVIPDPNDASQVFIFAVNHIPNQAHYGEKGDRSAPKSHSRIEIFNHKLGSNRAKHVRSVWHPLFRTLNDITALSPTSFLVTNDHFYTEGHLRDAEDLLSAAKWTDTIYAEFPLHSSRDDSDGVVASVALNKMHNNNGLGHGRTPDEVAVISCTSGIMYIGDVSKGQGQGVIKLKDSVAFESVVDNPSYFKDPYSDKDHDASGFVLAGLTRPIDLGPAIRDPTIKIGVVVWRGAPQPASDGVTWNKTMLFEDDGSRISTSSSAVLVAINPSNEDGNRRGWLFVTGFMSENMVAVKIDI